MARNIIVYGAAGYSNPKAVVLLNDVQQDSINLTERNNTPGKYAGVDAGNNVGTFDISLQDDFGAVGLFPNTVFPAGDPVTIEIPEKTAEQSSLDDVAKVGEAITYTSATGTSVVTQTRA